MKLYLVVFALPAIVSGYTTGGFDAFGRPIFATQCGPGGGRRCGPQQNRNQRGRQVDRAFEELTNELNRDRYRYRRRQGRRGPVGMNPNFRMDEESIRQQQEWVNKAFGLASEVAKGLASSPKDIKESNEALRQQQEWVNSIFGFAQDIASGESPTFVRSQILRDDNEMYQVALDLPGVKRSDVDITVEGDELKILSIRGKREIGNVEDGVSHCKKFSKSFAIDSTSDLDNISAMLDNGVLLVTVPKLPLKEMDDETVQYVQVEKVSDDSINVDDAEFKLELDVPGVKASNIDITITGDQKKTLTVSATREIGIDSDGSPRTKEIEKSYIVDQVVDINKMKAALNNGVLTISAPKDETKADARIKRIPIESGSNVGGENDADLSDEEKDDKSA